MRKIVFDIETKNIFQDVGRNDPSLLDISIVCTYDSEKDAYESFLEEDFPQLFSKKLTSSSAIIPIISTYLS